VWNKIKNFFKKSRMFIVFVIGLIFSIIALLLNSKNNQTVGDLIKDKKNKLDKKKENLNKKIDIDIEEGKKTVADILKRQKERDKILNEYLKKDK